jgi:hypothetical protein
MQFLVFSYCDIKTKSQSLMFRSAVNQLRF